ncbi:MAG: MmgE/PrpD family protein, partial [Proteobacteria bacterium]|nr:MmgE/PrpD family protein [Pseudomonadota bacterium]
DGVTAATTIHLPMPGVPDPFDGTPNFLGVHSVLDDPARAFRNLGRPLEITRTNIKRWSVGSPAQAVLDSVEALLAAQKISPDDIANVALRLTPRAALVVDGGRIQDINARHLAAVMLIDGTLTFASSHDTARLTDPAVAALRERIKVVPDETLPKEQSKREAIVDIVLRSGKTLRHRTRVVRGTTANPMSREEVETKALDLMAPVLDFNQTKSAIQAVRRIDGAGDVKKLVAALQIRA